MMGEGSMVGILWMFLFTSSPHTVSDTPLEDTSVVATVGRFTIAQRDLLDSYEFGPAFVKRLPDPLRRHLDYMIDERLLALDAERLRLDTTAFVRERVAALEEDLAVDELYREEILSRVHLSDAELDTALQKARMHVRLRWLYAPDKRNAERLRARLAAGATFDSLFVAMKDSPSDRSLETTVLSLEVNNPEFASAVRQLRVQETSAPLAGPDGYYIVRVDQIWQHPVLTETEYEKLRADAASALRAAKASRLAGEYVKGKMRGVNPVIKAEGYNIVRAYLADKGLSRDTRVKWNIPSTFMTEAGPMPLSASEAFLSRPLVTYGARTLLVRDYLRWFDIRQFQLKRTSLAAFNASVKQAIWKMVQDRLLSEEAYRRGLHTRTNVRRETHTWEAKLLYLAARRRLQQSIVVPDSTLRAAYERIRKRSLGQNGKPLSFEEVRDALWAESFAERERELLFRTLQTLRREHSVVINEPLLRALTARMQRDPHAIELKVYKPGGTFPRVAFPTIDERWQSFTR